MQAQRHALHSPASLPKLTSRTFPNPVTCSRQSWPKSRSRRPRPARAMRLPRNLPRRRPRRPRSPLRRYRPPHPPGRNRAKLFPRLGLHPLWLRRRRLRPLLLRAPLPDPWWPSRPPELRGLPWPWRRPRLPSWSSRRRPRQRKPRPLRPQPPQRLTQPTLRQPRPARTRLRQQPRRLPRHLFRPPRPCRPHHRRSRLRQRPLQQPKSQRLPRQRRLRLRCAAS